jgi:hypothetical protein
MQQWTDSDIWLGLAWLGYVRSAQLRPCASRLQSLRWITAMSALDEMHGHVKMQVELSGRVSQDAVPDSLLAARRSPTRRVALFALVVVSSLEIAPVPQWR